MIPFNVMLISGYSESQYIQSLLVQDGINIYPVENLSDAVSRVHTTDCIIFDEDTRFVDILKSLPNDEYSPYKIMLASEHAFSRLNKLVNEIGITKLIEKPIDPQEVRNAIKEARDFMGILRNNIKLSSVLMEKQESLKKVKSLNEIKEEQKQEELEKIRYKILQTQEQLKTIQFLMLKSIGVEKKEALEKITEIALFRHFGELKVRIVEPTENVKSYSILLNSNGYVLGKLVFDGIDVKRNHEELLRKVAGVVAIAYDKILRFSQLESKKQYWERVFDSIPIPVAYTNLDGSIVRANLAFSEIFSMDIRNIIGRKLKSLFGITNYQSLDNDNKIYKAQYKHKVYELKESRYKEFSKVYNVLILRDITKETKYSERLRVSERFAELGILSGSVAHEINNIVGGISALLQLLIEDEELKGLKEDLNEMYIASRRAKEIASNLLKFSRQTRQTDKQEILVQELIKTMLQFAVLQTKHENIEIIADLEEEPLFIESYFNDFMQAILNIVNISINTIKTNRKSLYEEGRISLKLRKKNNEFAIIEITDNAPKQNLEEPSILVTDNILKSLSGYLENTDDKYRNIYKLVFKLKA